jgi:tRNA dimethylallyltransferase
MKPLLIVLTGPTGIGKTETAVKLAVRLGCDIVSADSRQIYREMCIGTAVPSAEEMNGIRHHFIGTISIHERYNAGKFETEVISLLDRLFMSSTTAVMAGGSMLYIDAVCKGIDDLPAVDPEIRQSLIRKWETEGVESLRFELKKLDPEYYREVDLQNPKRLLHALEMCIMSGKPYSLLRTNTRKERPFHILKIGLTAPREVIYERINQRVDKMMEAGLEKEALNLYPFREYQALQTVGYREWFDFFEGKYTREETIEKIKSNSRRYARKQMTWFKKDPEIHWFDIREKERVIPFAEDQMESLLRKNV